LDKVEEVRNVRMAVALEQGEAEATKELGRIRTSRLQTRIQARINDRKVETLSKGV
jgi:hypothetical protein